MSIIPWSRGIFDPFSADLWDPFSQGSSSGGRRGRSEDDATALARANVDWRETDKAHIITAEIPGVKKEEVKVEVEDNNVLRISGQRDKEEEEKGDTWHRIERSRGSFQRRFRLPENADVENISCALEQGVLTVEVPKKETEKPHNIRSINIS
ncbi:hypothetical protein LUZ62_026560 [Rhynchospora pubera]|uniref:SHSP domain-containing protein n=1 Tax=Rhynchospora pubera TaxID=906938 RepID=A0AAV8D110_9POAL|nr:hypothetical protein LUZ62_071890 [Rhynchospora pubera]KAJ4790144.1 hypothetical protein LUZ62_041390 [Rhynchospora pubera]KAJ4813994.1 hypothetical protein LUZ62_026560 [Rhynchospora pubera]